eukprot:6739331-Pyramimonas_sp.AAC.1
MARRSQVVRKMEHAILRSALSKQVDAEFNPGPRVKADRALSECCLCSSSSPSSVFRWGARVARVGLAPSHGS